MSGVPPDCPVQLQDNSSNGRPAPNPNGHANVARTGQWTLSVRCAHRQQKQPTAGKWLGAINTPQLPHSKKSKFFEVPIQYKSKAKHSKTHSKHSFLSKTQNQLNHLVTWERESLCSFALLLLGLPFFLSHSCSQVLCKARKRHLSVWWSLQGLSDPID
jgi:hypothetical protein